MGTHVLLSQVLAALEGEIDDTEGGHELIGTVMDRLEAEAAAGDGLREAATDTADWLALSQKMYHLLVQKFPKESEETCKAGTCGSMREHRDALRAALATAPAAPERGLDVEREAVIGAAKALVATAASSGSTLPPGELGIGGQMMTGWIRGEPFEPLIDAVYELHRREDGAPPRVYEKQ